MEKNEFAKLINCRNPKEVRERVREWSSALSDQDHLIRSTILDIHANVEFKLKQIFYHLMLPLVFQDDDEKQNAKRKKALEQAIDRMSFMNMYRILKPCFDAFSAPDLANIQHINDVRNQAAHGNIEEVSYKGRNPFRDHDCLAQVFVESWAADKELGHFFERMIDDPRAVAKHYEKFYREYKEKPGTRKQDRSKTKRSD